MLEEDIKKALTLLNEMEQQGIIGKYAIGGSIGAIYWTEPFATKDMDIFLHLPVSEKGILLMPFLDYIIQRGYQFNRQFVQIGTLMLDFIGVYNTLTEEALEQALDVTVYGIKSRVFGSEHLLAIAIQTGRAHDLAKVEKLYSEGNINEEYLLEILARHHLIRKWNEFKKKYL